jgi:hypothetical protein
MAPWLGFMLREQIRDLAARTHLTKRLAVGPEWRTTLLAAGVAVTAAAVVFGLRSLSADYLVRVSAIVHGGSGAKATPRRSLLAGLVARWRGGQPSRAGFVYVSKMMLRDWTFRRQLLPIALLLILPLLFQGRGLLRSPFAQGFAPLHMLPHLCGLALLLVCTFLPYSSDHKGAWLFLLAPAGALGGFARGVHALLWITILAVPHAVLLVVLAWLWGFAQAALFIAYSLAVASVYLALELRLIEGVPFARAPNPQSGAMLLPVFMIGGVAMAIAVGLQYFLIFRSYAAVAGSTALVAAGAYLLTRGALSTFETAISFHLAEIAGQYGKLYEEVNT